ncbi:MAG: DSD1 family PLP-dependent enzyme [Planctomycetaceae bacterium]
MRQLDLDSGLLKTPDDRNPTKYCYYLPMIGQHVSELDTPTLCVDLDAMESNIAAMSDFIGSRGKQWRPHQKCHRSSAIAQLQLAAGAIGVTCATFDEAEVMARGGVTDLLIANMVVGHQQLTRLANLCESADPIFTVDHYAQAELLANAAREVGACPRVIIEVDVGMGRVGIRPGLEALRLYQGICGLEGIRPVGLMGYEGHVLRVTNSDAKRAQIADAMSVLRHTREMILKEQLCCDIVSAGGTGSYQMTSDCEGVTELQAGGGIFGDPFYSNQCGVVGLKPALSVLTTIVSRPTLGRAVVDAGRKAIAADPEMPTIQGYSESMVTQLSAAHGKLDVVGDARDLRIGDRVHLTVGYADFTTMLHRRFVGLRNDHVENVIPIGA